MRSHSFQTKASHILDGGTSDEFTPQITPIYYQPLNPLVVCRVLHGPENAKSGWRTETDLWCPRCGGWITHEGKVFGCCGEGLRGEGQTGLRDAVGGLWGDVGWRACLEATGSAGQFLWGIRSFSMHGRCCGLQRKLVNIKHRPPAVFHFSSLSFQQCPTMSKLRSFPLWGRCSNCSSDQGDCVQQHLSSIGNVSVHPWN